MASLCLTQPSPAGRLAKYLLSQGTPCIDIERDFKNPTLEVCCCSCLATANHILFVPFLATLEWPPDRDLRPPSRASQCLRVRGTRACCCPGLWSPAAGLAPARGRLPAKPPPAPPQRRVPRAPGVALEARPVYGGAAPTGGPECAGRKEGAELRQTQPGFEAALGQQEAPVQRAELRRKGCSGAIQAAVHTRFPGRKPRGTQWDLLPSRRTSDCACGSQGRS